MGEAKRRKQRDPNYGKALENLPEDMLKEKAKKWLEEANRILPNNFRPDYGHWYIANMGMKELNLIISGDYMVGKEKDGYMIIVHSEDFCTSITLSNQQHQQFLELKETTNSPDFQVKAVPCPSERYYAKGVEWVIPFKAISLSLAS
ncbi:hypothetical protein [Oscillatoria salina]|uniref:hypothetical protein n=1 Tax=Oscillatoria salina TaxID=331517 RepID=UPI0013B83379|nr:hypothetical protein [Oscillatoria salina]MBZ8181162.1 hypothetical protein [Oscillatoria salina IIICB1]NET88861.1 hypothetical protein [Kamptonema sp. SIO1D9]